MDGTYLKARGTHPGLNSCIQNVKKLRKYCLDTITVSQPAHRVLCGRSTALGASPFLPSGSDGFFVAGARPDLDRDQV